MTNLEKKPAEEIRQRAWDLATRIRFLREVVRENGDTLGVTEELRAKTEELGRLFPAGPEVARIDFQVRDTMEVKDPGLGIKSVNCLRVVQVNNPEKGKGAQEVVAISLLPKNLSPELLASDPLFSEILPLGLGGF
ncbi:hypothetical protein ISS42_02560 [Candidatus Shapirobacteria bacterium]|nr:hypothetical protein [Candidatus Shapirobacteria bacterium]